MPDNRIRSVAVLGGGAAGWMATAALARALGARCAVHAIVTPDGAADIGQLGAGETTLPPLRAFHQILGLNEDALMRATNGTFKLGTLFRGWGAPGQSYLHPFGEFGASLDSVAFHHHWLRLQRGGLEAPLESYSLAAIAAKAGKFARPLDDPRSVLSTFSYGLHLDGARYAQVLRDYAGRRGVRTHEAAVAKIEQNGETGFVSAVLLANGERVEADLFVDCDGALIEGALKIGYEDWSHWLPTDRILAMADAPETAPPPYTEAIAGSAGWQWRIPLQGATGRAYVYASRHLSDDRARTELTASGAMGEPKRLAFANGRRKSFWHKNVVSLGRAAGFVDPLESTNLHLVQSGIAKLLGLLPDRDCDAGESTEYNRLMSEEFMHIRDIVILHYKATERADTPFWVQCRAMEVPETLAYKMRLFRARGRVMLGDEETFQEPDWISVFIGQNLLPERYDPIADTIDAATVRERLDAMRRTIRQAADAMPNHRAFIAKFCPAS